MLLLNIMKTNQMISIDGRTIGPNFNPYIIAEMSNIMVILVRRLISLKR